jgi:tetratricopeptide (TPR) repeat protein
VKHGGELEQALEAPLASADGTRAAGAAWIAWAQRTLTPEVVDRRLRGAFPRTGPPSAALAGAIKPWLERLAERGQRRRLVGWVRRQGGWLAADTVLWAATGYALTRVGAHRRAARWLQDWKSRPGLEAWMLLNLGYSLSHLGRLAEAGSTCRAALQLPPDQTHPKHQAVVALEAALRGDLAPTAALTEGEDLGQFFGAMAALGLALRVGLGDGAPAARWRAALPHLEAYRAVRPTPAPRSLWVLKHRALGRLAASLGRGGIATAWWYLRALSKTVGAPARRVG